MMAADAGVMVDLHVAAESWVTLSLWLPKPALLFPGADFGCIEGVAKQTQ